MPEAATAPAPTPEVTLPPPSGTMQEPQVAGPLNNAFADLDTMMGNTPEPKQEAAPKGPPSKSVSSAAKQSDQAKAESKSRDQEQSAGDATKKEASGDNQENGKPLPAPELRRAYQELKAKHAALQAEHEKFKSTRPQFDETEVKTLRERLDASEKYRQKIDEELRLTAYERSDEFKQKYHQPFVDAYEMGRESVAQFRVSNPDGTLRQGTPDDFDMLMQILNPEEAARVAEEMFGPTKASMVMQHRLDVLKQARARHRALEEAQKLGSEREKFRTEHEQNRRKHLSERWEQLNKQAVDKYPDWFKEREGDDKGNELLKKGYELADAAFSGNANLPEDKLVELHSAIRNRAAAFGRTAYDLKQAKAQIAELQKELEAYKASEPKGAEGARGKSEESTGWEAQLEDLVGR